MTDLKAYSVWDANYWPTIEVRLRDGERPVESAACSVV
jgi:hypothetical protein